MKQRACSIFAAASCAVAILLASVAAAFPQALLSGIIRGPQFFGATNEVPFSGVLCFDSRPGSGVQTRGFRSWETAPVGWFRFSTDAGRHTLLFTTPAHYFRPLVMNNVFIGRGEKFEHMRVTPQFDFANFYDKEWDPKPARAYFQTFTATSRSVTHVGFKLATDGVDGFGPRSQNFLLSIHRQGTGTPDTWEQVGPARRVLDVDCGGAKSYSYSAAWNSGEIPLVPGDVYAVQLRAEATNGGVQAFWRRDESGHADCFRVDASGGSFQNRQLWMSVTGDGDGLLVPFNKCTHKTFGTFAGMDRKWSQTYVAQGRGLAGVLLYAAVSGAQPPLSRQRLAVRVRRDGPSGATVGVEKLAFGNGLYTGDASWGVFGVAFEPGEVPLEPGATYAIEFESIENHETLDGFTNIKGQVSDGRAGFNPYRKFAPDDYARGTAFKGGATEMPFDLDMQVVEYEFAPRGDWALATSGTNILINGDMTQTSDGKLPANWKTFSVPPHTNVLASFQQESPTNHFARVSVTAGQTGDGGIVQQATGLRASETYRITGRVRASWAVDFEHVTQIGCDATGQDTNPNAATIQWTSVPTMHGVFQTFVSEPVRPNSDRVSVWLRARSTFTGDKFAPFKAEFDDMALRRVNTGVPNR